MTVVEGAKEAIWCHALPSTGRVGRGENASVNPHVFDDLASTATVKEQVRIAVSRCPAFFWNEWERGGFFFLRRLNAKLDPMAFPAFLDC